MIAIKKIALITGIVAQEDSHLSESLVAQARLGENAVIQGISFGR